MNNLVESIKKDILDKSIEELFGEFYLNNTSEKPSLNNADILIIIGLIDRIFNSKLWDIARGPQGAPGPMGRTGANCYDIWKLCGNEGTEEDFLDWLKENYKNE